MAWVRLLLGYVLTGFVALLVMVVAFRGPLRIRFSVEAWRRSLAVGFPLFLVTVAGILFSTLDRLLVVAVLGFADRFLQRVEHVLHAGFHGGVVGLVVLLPRVCVTTAKRAHRNNVAVPGGAVASSDDALRMWPGWRR